MLQLDTQIRRIDLLQEKLSWDAFKSHLPYGTADVLETLVDLREANEELHHQLCATQSVIPQPAGSPQKTQLPSNGWMSRLKQWRTARRGYW